MRLVHKKTVNTQFLECDRIIFFLIIEFLNLRFQVLLRFLHLLDREFFFPVCLCFRNGKHNLVNLILDNGHLALR